MKGSQRDFKPEISFAGEVPLPPNVRPVIVLKGSNYDMGYQYYAELVHVFGTWIVQEIARDEFSKEELDALKVYQYYTKKYMPEIIDMMKGMADGATEAGVSLSYEEVLAHCTASTLSRERFPTHTIKSYPGAPTESEREKLLLEDGCSGWAAWGSTTADRKLICSGSTDHPYRCETTIVAFPEEGGNNFIISLFFPNQLGQTGGHPGMNNKGLAYVHHGATHWIRGKPEEEFTYGVKEGFAILHTLRFANNAAEAEKMQLSYLSGDGYAGGFWVDVSGNAFDIECRESPKAIRRPGDYGETDFLYSTNNALHKNLGHCQKAPDGAGNIHIPHGGWLGGHFWSITSVHRNLEIWNMLHNYRGKVNLEFAKMMWRFPGKPPTYPTLEEADAAFIRTRGEGWDIKICYSPNTVVGIMLPDDGDEGLYYVSSGCAARVANPMGPGPTGHNYLIEPTWSFYELKLASGPDKVMGSAKRRAQHCLYYANRELRKLNYSNSAYAPLDAIFNEAVAEWYKGLWYEGLWQSYYQCRAATTKGNEYVYNVGKAVRGFTRCQALAQKVYNALVAPATCPEDLGLQPWFGEWGEWATLKAEATVKARG